MMNDQQQQYNAITCQGRDGAQRRQEYTGNNSNQNEGDEALPETGHVVISKCEVGPSVPHILNPAVGQNGAKILMGPYCRAE
jgi:hypothetical protein